MFKILSYTLAGLFLLPACALCQQLTEITFKPGKEVVVINTSGKDITAMCEIYAASDRINSVSIVVTNGSGSFNGTTLKKGQTLTQKIYNLQNIPLSATKNTQANITNLGTFDITARCA